MNHQWKVEERDFKHNIIKIHVVNVDDSIKGGYYCQNKIVNGLYHRGLKRFSYYYKKYECYGKHVMRYSRFDDVGYHVEKEIALKHEGKFEGYPEIVHKNIYDFCKYIGYDYKNRSMKHIDEVLFLFKEGS